MRRKDWVLVPQSKVKKFMMLLQRRISAKFCEIGVTDRLPVKWVGKSILVAEQALIKPPYTIDSVVSATAASNGNTEDNGKSALLARVKHVVYPVLFNIFDILVATGTSKIGNEVSGKRT
jgi:hypothetical protein